MTKTYEGSCHCGAIRYQAELDLSVVSRCNCSICTKLGKTGVLIKPAAFRLVAGEELLSRYQPRPALGAHHAFCRRCGIHLFTKGDIPEIGGAFISVNANTLDHTELVGLKTVHFDGRHDNWQAGPRDAPWPIMV